MPITYTNLATTTLGSSQATVTFSGISQSYTDLHLRWSARTDRAGFPYDVVTITFNGLGGTNYNWARLSALGSGTASSSGAGLNGANLQTVAASGNAATANGFSYGEMYIPSYTNSSYTKPLWFYGNSGGTATTTDTYFDTNSGLTNFTGAITSISLAATIGGASFVAGSTFYLYGIKNS